MIEAIRDMTAGQLTWGLFGALTLLSTVVEIAPIKVSPWSWLAKKIGRAINGEVIEKVDKLEKEISTMKKDADEREEKRAEREVKDARARVLRFGDEIIHDVRHSKEHFDDILRDIGEYEHYCDTHPNFKNNQMHLTTQHIKATYNRCMQDHDFL